MSKPELQNPEAKSAGAPSSQARREFAKAAMGGMALLASAGSSSATMRPIPPGIKIGVSGGQPSEEHLLFLKQLGVTWVSLGATPATATAEGFIKIREQWEAAGRGYPRPHRGRE